ncbi:MAG TPA: helix-turn-helix domain-containing protein [Patescibacteria group bacterium]|nr:helix-turn-helix domain-containing protein [Patescibacteria group bacterium]
MYSQIFQEIGLTPNEAKIYETLLGEGELGISSISLNSGIHRRNTYDAIDRLVEKGLVFPILSKAENIYKAVTPAKLLEIIRAKESKLTGVLPALEEQYNKRPRRQETFIYRGAEGIKNYLRDILKTGADLCTIGSAGFLLIKQIKNFAISYRAEAKDLGLRERHIFNNSLRDKISEFPSLLPESYKFLPANNLNNTSINVFGDHVVSIMEGESENDLALYIIIDAQIADGYRQIFNILWENLPAQ